MTSTQLIRLRIRRGIALCVGQPAMLTGLPPCKKGAHHTQTRKLTVDSRGSEPIQSRAKHIASTTSSVVESSWLPSSYSTGMRQATASRRGVPKRPSNHLAGTQSTRVQIQKRSLRVSARPIEFRHVTRSCRRPSSGTPLVGDTAPC